MKRIMLLFAFILVFLASCNIQTTADQKDSERQEKLQSEGQAQAGLPGIHNFQEKKLLKQIYELRDNEKLICYAYLWNEYNGKLIFIGKCLGYGIPYSTQYDNPEHEVFIHGGFTKMTQAEPNGLFMPTSSEGTWLMMIDTGGIPHPVYIEPRIVVSPFKLNQ